MSKISNRRKHKRKKRPAKRAGRGNSELKMSAVILELAEPLLEDHGTDSQRVEAIIVLTIVAWNKSLLPADKQDDVLKDAVNTIVPANGDAEVVGTVVYMLDLIEARRKKLYPGLRKLVANYDLDVSEGRISLNIASMEIPTDG
jgi:hypothetical protein